MQSNNPNTGEDLRNDLIAAREEIKGLRAHINFPAPKAQAYDSIAVILSMLPQPQQQMGVDLVSVLERRIASISASMATPKTQVDDVH